MSEQESNHIIAKIAPNVDLQNASKKTIINISMSNYSPVSLMLNCNVTDAKLCIVKPVYQI